MKPKTKLQIEVYQLSQRLSKITTEQEKYAFKHCFKHWGYRLKKGVTTCMECGATFQHSGKEYVCTECNTRLTIEDTRRLKYSKTSFFAILTIQGEFQIIRFFEVRQYLKKGGKAYYSIHEVLQRYFKPDGKETIVAVPCTMNGAFSWGNLEIRNPSRGYSYNNPLAKYEIYPDAIYPEKQVLYTHITKMVRARV